MDSLPYFCGIEANGKFKRGDAARFRRAWVGGGGFSNTPHQTSKDKGVCVLDLGVSPETPVFCDERVTGGEDAFVVNLRMTWAPDDESMASLLALLEPSKSAAQCSKTRTAPCHAGGLLFEMAPRGVSIGGGRYYMDYVLRTSGLKLMLSCDRTPRGRKGFNGRVELSSALLMAHDGARNCWAYVKAVLSALGAEIQSNQLGRVDACADLGYDMAVVQAAYQGRQFVTRCHKHSAIYEGTDTLQTVYFGLTGIRLRIYDKEAEVQGNDVKKAIMLARRLFGKTRVEFQLRREELGAFLVETVEDWFQLCGGICEYLTTQWIRFTEPIANRTHTSRAKVIDWWEDTVVAFRLAFQNDLDVPACCRPVHFLTSDPIALVKQAFGCLAAAHVIVGQGAYEEMGRFVAWAGAKLAEVAGVEYEGVMDGKSLRYMVGNVDISHIMRPCPF